MCIEHRVPGHVVNSVRAATPAVSGGGGSRRIQDATYLKMY